MQVIRRSALGISAGLGLVMALTLCVACSEQDKQAVTSNTSLTSNPKVDMAVRQALEDKGQVDFWVDFSARADLKQARLLTDWSKRGEFVYQALKATAEKSQASVKGLLNKRGVSYRPFWIKNSILVRGGTYDLALNLAEKSQVRSIRLPGRFQIPEPLPAKDTPHTRATEWGLDTIRATEVWSDFGILGEDIVIANIDTGVEYTHPALKNQYRGNLGGDQFDHNYNWYDPSGACGTDDPCDNHDHGSHTMGTMVGDDGADNQIGVAPGATWIAAKGCESSSCSDESLVASGQWMVAPTDMNGENPRPDLRPHIINNSWGSTTYDDFYQDVVDAWVAAGIFPAFAAGNAGSGCETVGSPGDYLNSYASGAFASDGQIASFSSRGASAVDGEIKPDIASPGVNVRSSVRGGDYSTFSGTSMASPHTAGAVALLWSAAPALVGDIDATRALFDGTAIPVDDLTCGGTAEDNNVWGKGMMDVYAAAEAAPIGPWGILAGTVTDDESGEPIQGARVAVVGEKERSTTTDADGFYSLRLSVGSYAVTAVSFGYLPTDVNGVEVVDGQTTDLSLSLALGPVHEVSGVVEDKYGNGLANVSVAILQTPLAAVNTDENGNYHFTFVPVGEYQITARPDSKCLQSTTQNLVVDSDERLDFEMLRRTDGYGHTCSTPKPFYLPANTKLDFTGDDATYELELPFVFYFYGRAFSTAYLSTNGHLNFNNQFSAYSNRPIPQYDTLNGAICPFWDDLKADGESQILTRLLGAEPRRRLVIEWRNMTFYEDSNARIDFEIVLFESGDMLIQYRNIDASSPQQGNSATLGIESPDGTDGFLYSYNQPALPEGSFAIRYHAPANGNLGPQANAGEDQTAMEGSLVTLDGSQSSDPDGQELAYDWVQTAGPTVELDDATSAQPTFVAPQVTKPTGLIFQLVVSDGELNSTADQVEVMVEDGTVWDIQQSAEDTPIAIPDADADGIVSQIEIQHEGVVVEAQVDVEIAHTYIGDLVVTAVCPDGTEVVVHNKSGGGADDLDQSYSITECNGQSAAGTWQLKVSDNANVDTGELTTWTIKIDLEG